jgi:hypothetical protein
VTGALLAALFAGVHAMLGVAVGAGLAAANLWTIGLVMRGYMGQLNPNVPWALVGMLKFILLFAGVYALLKSGVVPAGPLFIGYGALPLGIVGAQLGGGMSPERQRMMGANGSAPRLGGED